MIEGGAEGVAKVLVFLDHQPFRDVLAADAETLALLWEWREDVQEAVKPNGR